MVTNPQKPTDDILADWKNGRFMVIDPLLAGYLPPEYASVILTDISYWAEHEAELDAWLEQHQATRSGMIVEMRKSDLVMFSLRWS